MDLSVFKKIGLSDKEIKVYLSLLECGAVSVRGLAKLTGLNRGTVYDILKKLQEDGLVSFYHHDTKQRFVAEDPEKLNDIIGKQEREFFRTREKIKEAIPELRSIQDKGETSQPTTKFYEGKSGIRTILDDVLLAMKDADKKEREYYVYSATKASSDINNAYPEFTANRIKKEIRVKAISLASGGKVSGLDERRWLGTRKDSATFIIIYNGKCAFISRDKKGAPVGVIIENEMIYATQKIIFLALWEKIS
ncbi:MAG: helix-turn-helix domain-containing protein [Candidatus Falkowbacteria bacterium]